MWPCRTGRLTLPVSPDTSMARGTFDMEAAGRLATNGQKRLGKRREDIIQVYWTLRNELPDDGMDRSVAFSEKAHLFCSHLFSYERRISPTIDSEANSSR